MFTACEAALPPWSPPLRGFRGEIPARPSGVFHIALNKQSGMTPTPPSEVAELARRDSVDGGQPSADGRAEPSLSEVYRECAPAIHRMMLRLGIPERYAEDATNDVFVTALPRWDEFRGDSTRRTWLFGFALKIAANQRRKLGRAGEETALSATYDLETSPSPNADPFEQTSARQTVEQLQALLDTLSMEERGLWVLVYYEDVSVTDAAEILGISAPKAYVQAKWVHAKLVKAWKRQNPPDAWRTWQK